MAWRCSGKTNVELVDNLIKSQILQISSEASLLRISQAMKAVDRAHFVQNTADAYLDSPQAIGHGATISAPHMHAYAVDHLLPFLRPGSRVLDVGSGSGYLAAVLHHLVTTYAASGPTDQSATATATGKVVGIDHIPELVDWSLANLRKDERSRRAVEQQEIQMISGDGRLGYPNEGPYDAIHLATPGRMFIPVGTLSQHIYQVDKDANGNVTKTKIMAVNYVPLTDRDKQTPW
ncbi:Protein-L-isoaspartate O-methyltransferase [Mycena indigotica]|uniref:protein-L-isoaspartate(D-aspartate) O-methyltransferase n=1 Tax=Mycena indigotica TaxID=2126181 RepID=A0A8H6S5H0_9AGAR|nr:Protein-L-isoaspartate O-methyltransferase [Mycena indigotica]KAF7292777.1 Protein-L-isoaspartate O-methyltransferase [Mycena indigotica]